MRPTVYSDETLKLTEDYAKNFAEYGDKIPSIAGLACFIGVTRQTIHEWKNDEDKPEFSYTLDAMLGNQERVALNNGIDGTFNAAITKLVLYNHGYSEKSEVKSEGKTDTKIVYVEPEEKQQLENHIGEIVDAN